MNMRPPMSKSSYENSLSDLHIAYVQTARESMRKAAEEIRRGDLGAEYDNDTIVGTTASFDGSWQRRGFASV